MLRVEITGNSRVQRRKGTFLDEDSGKEISYDFFFQDAYLHQAGKPYPVEFQVRHAQKPDDSTADGNPPRPYAPGFYAVAPESFTIRNGRLSVASVLQLTDDTE